MKHLLVRRLFPITYKASPMKTASVLSAPLVRFLTLVTLIVVTVFSAGQA